MTVQEYNKRYTDASPGIIPQAVRHDQNLMAVAKLVYVELVLKAGNGACTIAPDEMDVALNLPQGTTGHCLSKLRTAGHVWVSTQGVVVYGTTSGLWQQMLLAASMGKKADMVRLKRILKECTVFGTHDELKKHMGGHAPG